MTPDGECKLLRGLLEDKKRGGVMISSVGLKLEFFLGWAM